jgi:hypothetical protein
MKRMAEAADHSKAESGGGGESDDADSWDRQLEADAAAGRLDALAEEALSEHRAGRTRSL